jgi:hypothetical protein
VTHQRRAQSGDPGLAVSEDRAQQLLASLILDQQIVLLRRPVHTRAVAHRDPPVS